ncbi:unnamed protein product [Brassicogethes aeneus]|uniref:Epoxide hydrolase n=1 Tax=Brassicogethes aeneus TaxID=1431903 RepID=A0A9P0ATF4_BRAAE|nr:unnamed protein product [Brassicogethes aeneus]
MAFKSIVLTSSLLLLVSITFYAIKFLHYSEVQKLENVYWGPGEPKQDDPEVRPFRIDLKENVLKDIHHRLNLSRPQIPPLEDTETQYGYSGKIMEEVMDFLKTEYNFKEQQKFLNTFPQFVTEVQGLKIHFLHVKPNVTDDVEVFPILMLHGWPSSVREYYGMIPEMVNPADGRKFVFEIVAPSLPGFGYSDAPSKKDCQGPEMALIFKNLMEKLGHRKFYVHGSDWGAVIGTHLSTLYPHQVIGFHSNFCISLANKSIFKILVGMVFPSLIFPEEFQHKWYPPMDTLRFFFSEAAYLLLQATKPDTIGVSLDQSLQGLIAFMFDKMSVGTDKDFVRFKDGGLPLKYNYTILFDNLIFYYWVPQKATTAARLYSQNLNYKIFQRGFYNNPVDKSVPCGCTVFAKEFLYFPEEVLRDTYRNLIHFTTHKDGGHFAGLEMPDVLVKDLLSFVEKTLPKTRRYF